MKKNLLIALLFVLSLASVRADLIWYEGYNYSNGPIVIEATNSAGVTNVWARHSGSANPSDAIVTNNMQQVSATGGSPISRQDDVHRNLTNSVNSYTNSAIQVYASFTLIVTSLPGGTNQGYFAHFLNGTTTFYGRIFCTNGTQAGTYRLGVSALAGTPSSGLYPADLLTNVPYQVVVTYDAAVNRQATLWINPLNSGDSSVSSSDVVATQQILQSFAFRQGSTFGNFFCSITNLATATTFAEAATNIASPTPVPPTIVKPLVGFSGFVGVSNALSVIANGQSLANLTYQWQLNGANISTLPDGSPTGSGNVLSFANPTTNDSGNYSVVITVPATGLAITSAPVAVSVTFAPVPPTFTQQPSNVTVYPGQTANLSVATTGPGPITYQWYYNSVSLGGLGQSSTLAVNNVQTNNGTAGIYECDAINTYGTNHSSNAVVSVTIPPVVTINYIRGLVDPVFFLPTNTSLYYTTTGTVISKTNFTTSANDECFITDGTGSISVFYGGAATFRPNIGDVVTVTGPISQFNSLIEFSLSATDPSTTATIISSNNPAPLATVLPLSFTNSVAYGGTSNALRLYGGSLAMFTNITITPGGGTNTFAGSGSYTLTDGTGASLTLFVYSGFSDLISNAVPSFCYSITGVLSEFLGATAPDRSSGYQLEVSEPSDFVTAAPSPVTVTEATKGALTWTAVPYSYSYSVYAATNVAGPYLPLQTGLLFATSAGSYTDTNTSAATRFYRVSTP